jgi:hypothetical protein
MIRVDNFIKFLQLRRQYHSLAYESYKYTRAGNHLVIEFTFNLADRYLFRPMLKVPLQFNHIQETPSVNLSASVLDNLVFHIGMIELVSYWKAACPSKIIIKPFSLGEQQLLWWKKLYYLGLGEFFYMNSIQVPFEDYVTLSSDSPKETRSFSFAPKPSYLIPVGGGKDSAVTLELLSRIDMNCIPFVINPQAATDGTIRASGISPEKTITFQRKIHPRLLSLNEKGYLNGHTPFSALLAFSSLLGAYLAGYSNIALSNESSANEPTVPGTSINHQYSKSFEFEEDFRQYVGEYISPDFNYFSFLRPLSELQIARIFSAYPKYFNDFRSCNAGTSTNSWCGKCAKCLFTYIILSPFLDVTVLQDIFNKDLFSDETLSPVFDELTGIDMNKPFDCVGTTDEVNVALTAAIKKYYHRELPALLSHYLSVKLPGGDSPVSLESFLKKFEKRHHLSDDLFNLIKQELS